MAFGADHVVLLDHLQDALLAAPQPTFALFAKIVAGACTRVPVLAKAGSASSIGPLIEAGAWTDAALALIELELPAWTIHRLVREDDEWTCSLSRQPNLPSALDDAVDARHEVMAFAILLAFLEARRVAGAASRPAPPVSEIKPAAAGFVCCDNFA